MSDTKKYYWLKLDRNFFKRHDVRIVEDMPNGKEYVLFFMKLLVESIDHEGRLRFNDFIPYNEQMLGTVTNTNIDIVRSAINIFEQLDLLSIMDDKTIYIHDTQKMLGAETEWAKKKRAYREQKLLVTDIERTKKDNVRQELEKEIEKELEIDIEKEVNTTHSVAKVKSKSSKKIYGEFKHIRLTDEEYSKLQNDYGNAEELIKHLDEYIEMKGAKYKSHYLAIKKWVVDAVKERKQPKTSRAAKVVEQPVYTKQEEPVDDIDEYLNYAQEFLKGS